MSADALATGHFQDVLGNGLLLDAIAGNDIAGFGGMVAGEVAASMAGIETGGFASNAAMARALRDAISPEAGQVLSDLRLGGGHAIPMLHKERMERAFSHDFGHVRLHTDAKAAQAAEAISAYAFAIGADIFFGTGTFALGSSQGDRLLAHELTHVVQHDEGRIPVKGSNDDSVSSPSDPLEREAYGNEVHILSVLHQVDAELRAESLSTEPQVELGDQVDAAVDAPIVEDLADLAPTVTIDGPSADLDEGDFAEAELAGDSVLDLGGFTADAPGGDAAADDAADDGIEGAAMRDASGLGKADKSTAQQHIKKSRGTPISGELAARLSPLLGHDVSHAVLHTDAAAADAATALEANAFALGADVFFAKGAFQPGTTQGDELLAHELTHVVQHAQGRLPTTGAELEVSSPTDSLEREASKAGESAAKTLNSVDTDALSWGEPAAPEVIADRLSLAMGIAESPVGPIGLSDLDNLALSMGAGAFAPSLEGEHTATNLTVEDTGLALREAAQGSGAGADDGVALPEEFTFIIAGVELILDAKRFVDSLPKVVEIPIDREPIPGLSLKSAKLDLDESGKPNEGTITADLKIGDLVAEGGLELTVDQEFNVTAEAQDVKLTIGDAFEATASVTLTNSDVTASVSAEITKEISVGSHVTVTKGSMEGTYAEGNLHLEGGITMRFGDWVEGVIEATYDVGTSAEGVDGDLDMRGDGKSEAPGSAPSAPSGGEQSGGEPSGGPSGDQGEGESRGGPEGGEDEAVDSSSGGGDQESSGGEGDDGGNALAGKPEPMPLSLPGEGKWSAQGTLTQLQDLTKGDVTLTDSTLTVKVENNVMDTVQAKATVLAPHLEGKVEGQLDVPNDALHGFGTIHLTEAFRLEEMGVTIDTLDAKVEVKANKLESIKGGLSATVDYEEEPTFKVVGEDLEYVYADEKFSGTGTVTLLRDLTFGPEEGTHLKVLKDASAEAILKDSDVDKINAGLKFEVNDKTGQLGEGEVHLERGGEGAETWSGKGSFALTGDYGMPEREAGPLFLKEESTLNVTFAESAPETAELENVQFLLKQEGDKASGTVEGKVEGTYTFETDKVTGSATAAVTSDWPVEVPFGKFTLNEGGKVDIEVTDSAYESIDLQVPYTADVDIGHKFQIKGEAEGVISGETDQYTGKISGNLEEDLIIPIGKDGSKLSLLQEASVEANIESNELKQVDFDAHVQYFDAKSELYFDGTVEKAKYIVGDDGGKLDLDGKLALMKDLVAKTESGDLQGKFLAGPGINVKVRDNALTEIGGEGRFQVWDKSLLLDGSVKDAKIDLTEDVKVSGRIDVKTGRDLDFPRKSEGGGDEASTGTKFSLVVKQHSGVGGNLEENEITKLDGQLDFVVNEEEGGALAEGGLKGEWLVDEDKFTGDGELKLTRDYPLKEGAAGEGRLEGWSINLKKDSGVEAAMVDNKLQKAEANVDVDFKKDSKLMAEGNIEGQYALGQSEGFSGSAGVRLVESIDWAEDSTFSYHLTPPTAVKAAAVDSSLTSAKGIFVVDAKSKEDGLPKVRLTADTTYEPGAGITGDATVKVLDDMKIASKAPWDVFLQKDSGGTGSIKNDELTEISGTLKLGANKSTVPTIKGEFKASYKLSDGADATVNASGQAELLVDLGGDVGESGYKYYIEKGTKAGAELTDGALTKVDGTIKARVEDDKGHFIKAEAKGSYATEGEESKISVSGTAKVSRTKTLVDKSFKIDLVQESSATVEVNNNQLDKIAGNVKLHVSDADGDFAEGALDGSWIRDVGTTGEVVGKLLREIDMGKLGEYKFFVEKGSGGDAKMEADELVSVGGNIDIRIDDAKGEFLQGTLKGDYKLKGGTGFTGSGSMEVKREKQLGELAGQKLFVEPGTGADVTIQDNAIKTFGGNVNLSLRDDKGEYVEVKFDGSYDVGSKAFTGGGGAKVTREKKLFGEDSGYSFWLKPSDSFAAQAEVTKNKLTKVGGTVPFMVKDGDPLPLIVGEAGGTYLPETGKFDGSGEVFLGRDVTYNIGGGGKLVFKEGSGGKGDVVASKLEKLGGKLNIEVHDKTGHLLSVNAQGEFDAVKSKILWVEGEATLERAMEPLGKGVLVIESLTGRARVEDNELKWAEGEGDFSLPALNNMQGHIRARYENRGGEEIYTGAGSVNFTLFSDPSKGREMKGKIDAELFEGGKFRVKGEADYKMSEMISGDVSVEMDEKMDPSIDASMTISKELIPAQDLFRLKMDLIPHTDVPIYGPIALGFGASGGLGLSTLPLMMSTTIGFQNWHPIGEDTKVPDFTAELGLQWGLNLDAMLAAYMTLGLTAGVGSAGAGIRGEARLDAPLTVDVGGKLQGKGGEFTGELGIGVKLEPSVTLAAIPFVMAQLTGFGDISHDFPGIEADLGSIFSVEWGSKYTFGDVSKTEDQPATPMNAGDAASTEVEHKAAPAVPAESVGTPQAAAGGPQMESGSEIAGGSGSDRAAEGGSEMGELEEKIAQVTVLAEGLGAVAYLLGLLVSIITALITFGPAGLVIMLAWKIITGELTWDNLVEAVEKTIEAVTLAAELLRPHLPDWLNGVIDFFSGDKPSLIDAFFGADDKIRAEVDKGTHLDFPNDSNGAEMTAGFIDEMLSGWCGNADEDRILILLRFAEGRGQLHSVVGLVDGGADRLHSKLDWSQNDQLEEIFDRNGIDYDSGWF